MLLARVAGLALSLPQRVRDLRRPQDWSEWTGQAPLALTIPADGIMLLELVPTGAR